MNFSDADGEIIIKIAREAVTEYLKSKKRIVLKEDFKTRFSFNSGVFVTLNNSTTLRGCIGNPLPEKKLYQSLVDAAILSATQDPRFPSVKYNELNEISFEVTILTPPIQVKVEDPLQYPTKIKVGRDGLIVKWEYGSGLLLPQVPIEFGWNEEEFLSQTCEKAGAPSDCWKRKETMVLKFEGTIFKESNPMEKVVRVAL